jgi:hypothetical protein
MYFENFKFEDSVICDNEKLTKAHFGQVHQRLGFFFPPLVAKEHVFIVN